jgi:hypothetical protein
MAGYEETCSCPKKSYQTREDALIVAEHRMQEPGAPELHVYQCMFNPRVWHLTSKRVD